MQRGKRSDSWAVGLIFWQAAVRIPGLESVTHLFARNTMHSSVTAGASLSNRGTLILLESRGPDTPLWSALNPSP